MQRFLQVIILLLITHTCIIAQYGGETAYNFLKMPGSARITSLGGYNISLYDSTDINMSMQNPALLFNNNDNELAINCSPYMAGIFYGDVVFGKKIKKVGMFSFGIHALSYGSFDSTDEYENDLGTTSAGDYAFIANYSRQFSEKLSMGISIKPIYSRYDSYSSFGIAADFGVAYNNNDRLISYGATIKNLGSQITTYYENYEPLPFDIQLGLSKSLKHAPFRFSVTAYNLTNWSSNDYSSNSYTDNEDTRPIESEDINVADNILRHLIFGVEFLPTKNFYVNLGYNHGRRQELGYVEKMSTAGFSWGFGFKVYSFRVSYGSARYTTGGSTNHFSISKNLSDL